MNYTAVTANIRREFPKVRFLRNNADDLWIVDGSLATVVNASNLIKAIFKDLRVDVSNPKSSVHTFGNGLAQAYAVYNAGVVDLKILLYVRQSTIS